jgi:hypothetical protein
MITMALIVGGGFLMAMFLMRRMAAGARRDHDGGIRWRGIDWSRAEPKPDRFAESDEDHLRKSQD